MKIIKKDYDWQKQSLFSQKQFNAHCALYLNYCNRCNDLLEIDDKIYDSLPYSDDELITYKEKLKQPETYDLNGVVLHELFFENIEKVYGFSNSYFREKMIVLYNLFAAGTVVKKYDNYDFWEQDFKQRALESRGWVIFCYEPLTQIYRNISLESHNYGFAVGFKPLIVLDCYEHSYWFDFLSDKQRYINDFMENINWDIVEKRLGRLNVHE